MQLDQRGFTLMELLISIGILAVVAPLLATGMFQVLTYTERGRAGFEAQADTRTAAAWMSQDIEMAQAYFPAPSPTNFCTGGGNFLGTFAWYDLFGDPEPPRIHTVSYCMENYTRTDGTVYLELLRSYDCGAPVAIGRQMDPDQSTPDLEPLDGIVTFDISSDPVRNRFQVTDTKTIRVKLRPEPVTGSSPLDALSQKVRGPRVKMPALAPASSSLGSSWCPLLGTCFAPDPS